MSLVLVGTNHRKTGMALRECLAERPQQAVEFLERLKSEYQDFEAVVLSTCNRFEVLLWRPSHARPDIPDILNLLANALRLPVSKLDSLCYGYRRDDAVRHFFRVACGLDSMLVGEPQIIGQIRQSLAIARNEKTAGPYLTRLVQNALTLAKRIRQSADISEGYFSLGAVAAEFATQIFGSLADKSFLVIGAGKMGTSALHRLIAGGAKKVLIVNRDQTKSKNLADSMPGTKAIGWDEIDDALARVNVVVTCVSVTDPILTLKRMEQVSTKRSGWPMLLIDLGLPRNVDSSVGALPWVHLYDLDALGHVLEEQNSVRRMELEKCHGMIDDAVLDYDAWQQQRTVTPAIVSLRQKIHTIAQSELARLSSLDNSFTPEQWALVEKTVHRIVHKMLHDPTTALTEASLDSRAAVYAGVLRKLFNLPESSAKVTRTDKTLQKTTHTGTD